MILKNKQFNQNYRLSFKLLFYIILCSSIFTILGTCIQLYNDFSKDVEAIKSNMSYIGNAYLKPLASSLWDLNNDQIMSNLEGAIKLPGIEYLEIKEISGITLVTLGTEPEKNSIIKEFPLNFEIYNKELGTLIVVASKKQILQRLKERIFLILVTQAFKTFIVSLFIFGIFQYLIMRHLTSITQYFTDFDIGKLDKPVKINRKPVEKKDSDLFELLIRSINGMRQRLKDSLIQREVYQKELEHLQDQLKSIIDNMPAMLIGLNKDARVTQWNLQAQKETHIKMEKAIGKKLVSLIPALSDYMNVIDQSCKENRPIRKIEIQKQINGQPSFWDLMVYPLGSDSRSSVIRLENVTERVKINQMLIQSEKMVSVGGLAAGMAHEINNPLAGMVQNAQVVITRINKDLPDNDKVANELGTSMDTIRAFMEKRKILKHLQMIRESGNRASKIVKNMLNFSRKKNLRKSPHHIAKLLDKALDLMENDFNVDKRNDFKQITIQKEYEENLSPIFCEANEIQQVFLNILKNSAEVMAGQKQPEIILRIFNLDRNTHIEIKDNGPGMNDSVKKRIFEPFFTTKPVDKGTGLGLSVSYMIITENHKGTMQVESKLKKGTKFIICLPQDS